MASIGDGLITEISIKTGKRNELVDITCEVQKAVAKSGVKEGLCIVYCPHTTAAITINENADHHVKHDILTALERLVPKSAGYSHAEGNSDAHIKAALMGNSRAVLVQSGRLLLGAWEGIMLAEFDGPRQRKLIVSVK